MPTQEFALCVLGWLRERMKMLYPRPLSEKNALT